MPFQRDHGGVPAREHDAALAWMLEFIAAPVALVVPRHAPRCNGALERMLARESDGARRRIREALRQLGESMFATAGAPAPPDERLLRLRTKARRYALEPLPAPTGAPLGLILVHRSRTPDDPDSVARRFGLTRREAEIALLIGHGQSNKAIAAELRLSPHTVRRHTENVFRKVGVTSRAALSARLHG